jgi:hypothetical protein
MRELEDEIALLELRSEQLLIQRSRILRHHDAEARDLKSRA